MQPKVYSCIVKYIVTKYIVIIVFPVHAFRIHGIGELQLAKYYAAFVVLHVIICQLQTM